SPSTGWKHPETSVYWRPTTDTGGPLQFIPFELERWQSTWENRVRYNLSESGVHPLSIRELLDLAGASREPLLDVRLGYSQSNGTDLLRSRIAALYPGVSPDQILVTTGSAEANFVVSWRLIVARAAEVGAWLLADEVYQGAERDGTTTPSLWGSYERVIVVNGLSKAYGLPGLRIGWVVGPPGFSDEAWARHDYTTIGPAGASDHLAAVA